MRKINAKYDNSDRVVRERSESEKNNNMHAVSRVSKYCYFDHDDDKRAA